MSLYFYGLQLLFAAIGLVVAICILVALMVLVTPFLWFLDRMIA